MQFALAIGVFIVRASVLFARKNAPRSDRSEAAAKRVRPQLEVALRAKVSAGGLRFTSAFLSRRNNLNFGLMTENNLNFSRLGRFVSSQVPLGLN